jgi:antitoxin component YwqK of YwqJK toxin-antitoxin module
LIGFSSAYGTVKKEFYQDGKILSETSYNAKGDKDGVEKRYNKLGVVVDETTWVNGIAKHEKKYFDTGELQQDSPLNGTWPGLHYEGVVTDYFMSGKIRHTAKYNAKHNKDGIEKTLNKLGVVVDEITWVNGIAKHEKKYFDSGELQQDSSLNGTWPGLHYEGAVTDYYKNGKIRSTGSYDAINEKDGIFKEYDKAGKLTAEYLYKHGALVSKKAYK